MNTLIEIVVQIALIVAGWKLYRWSKSKAHAGAIKWRRRIAALLFVAPMFLWLFEAILPDALQDLVAALSWLNSGLDALLTRIIGSAKTTLEGSQVSGVWLIVIKPVIYSLTYGLLGAVIGWPLDRLRNRKAEAETEGMADAGPEADPEKS